MHRLFSPLYSSIITGILFVSILQIPFFLAIKEYGNEKVAMNTSVDELYYAALIQKSKLIQKDLGSVTLKEHKNAPPTASFGPKIQKMMMKYGNLSIVETLMFGTILYTFLTIFFLNIACNKVLQSKYIGSTTAIILASIIGIGFLRPISPQITLLIISIHLALFMGKEEKIWSIFCRSINIGCLLFIHIVSAPLLLAIEGIWFVMEYLEKKEGLWIKLLTLLLPITFAGIAKILITANTNQIILKEVYTRLGLIDSHLPAAPLLQCSILFTLIIFLWVRHATEGKIFSKTAKKILILLISLLLALNQSLIHGKDIVFGLYYYFPAIIIVGITWSWNVKRICSDIYIKIGTSIIAIIMISILLRDVQSIVEIRKNEWMTVGRKNEKILQEMQKWKQETTIVAPFSLSNHIPIWTKHFVLTNQYAHYQWGSTKELAERYLLQEFFFPTDFQKIDTTYPKVFGIAAGNIAARKRTLCKIIKFLSYEEGNCTATIRDSIADQITLKKLDMKQIDVEKAFRDFHINTIISDKDIPMTFQKTCKKIKRIDEFTMWDCPSFQEQ